METDGSADAGGDALGKRPLPKHRVLSYFRQVTLPSHQAPPQLLFDLLLPPSCG